jgi:hypothetical protein
LNEQQPEGINNNRKDLRYKFQYSFSSLNYHKVLLDLDRIEAFLSFKVSRLYLVSRFRLGGFFPIEPLQILKLLKVCLL